MDAGKLLADAGRVMDAATDIHTSAQTVQLHLLGGKTEAAYREWMRLTRLVRALCAIAPHENDARKDEPPCKP